MKKLLVALIFIANSGYAQGTITTYPSTGGVTGLTSNGSAITSTLPILLPNGTAANNALAFSAEVNLGLYRPSSNILCFGGGGQCQTAIQFGTLGLKSSSIIAWSTSATDASASKDLVLVRENADILAQRRTTNAQTFNLYNTFTDTSNYGRLAFVNTTTSSSIISQVAGTGTGGFLSTQGSVSKSLTDAAAAVSFVRIAIPTGGMIGGKVIWTAQSTDGTDQRALTGSHYFSFADKAGTPTCGTPGLVGTANLTSTNANTLACTITAAASTTNCDLQVTCTDNTAGSQTMSLNYRLDMPTSATVTPQ